MDIRDFLTILLSATFLLTGYRAIRYKRYILAASCACLLFIPLSRFGVVPRNVALLFTNIGAFGLMYKVNWFLHHFTEEDTRKGKSVKAVKPVSPDELEKI